MRWIGYADTELLSWADKAINEMRVNKVNERIGNAVIANVCANKATEIKYNHRGTEVVPGFNDSQANGKRDYRKDF